MTADEFRKARVLAETGVGEKAGGDAGAGGEGGAGEEDGEAKRKKKRKKKKLISTLSFGEEIAKEEEEGSGDGAGTGKKALAWGKHRLLFSVVSCPCFHCAYLCDTLRPFE